MITIGILTRNKGYHYRALEAAFAARGAAVRAFGVDSLPGGVGVATKKDTPFRCDGFIQRAMPGGSLEQIVFRMDALYAMENRGMPFLNSPKAMERTVDKFYTSFLLQHNSIPTPRTLATESAQEAMEAFLLLGKNVVTKPLFGSGGVGMLHLTDADQAWQAFQSLAQEQRVIYLQEFIPCGNRDVRVLVLGGEIIAAMERQGQDFRANLSQGGTARSYAPHAAEQELALRAAAALGTDCAGVDLLVDNNGRVMVCEVNGSPGFQGLVCATGVDVAGCIAHFLLKKCANQPVRLLSPP